MALWDREERKHTENKVLPLKDIVFDENIYPRQSSWWQTSYKYAEEMKAGARFPPITVGFVNGRYVLVDGKHRNDALLMNKETHTSVVVLYGYTLDELYIEAVKLNRAHGVGLTSFDKVKIIKRLEDMKYSLGDIATIVQIPLGSIEKFVAQRITLNPLGQVTVLKSPLKFMAGGTITMTDEEQDTLSVRSEISLVNQMTQIFSNPKMLRVDITFVDAIEKLYQLIQDFLKEQKILNGAGNTIEEVPKEKIYKKRGRPKKIKTESETSEPKKKGRPKGSKNKLKELDVSNVKEQA